MSFLEDFAGMVQDCPSCLQNVIVPCDRSGQAGKLPLPIATSRLTLRRFEARDWKDLLEVVSNEELFRHMDGEPSDEDQVLHWLEQDRELRLALGFRFSLAVELQAEGRLIGYAQLWFEDELRRQAGLAVVIGQAFQGKGYGTETAAGLLRFGFEGLHLHRMIASTDSRATACLRMLAKAGLRREGEFVKNHWLKGEWADTAWFAMLAQEYAALAASPAGEPPKRQP